MAYSGRGYVTIVGRKRLWSDHLERGYVTIVKSVGRTDKGRYRAARAAEKVTTAKTGRGDPTSDEDSATVTVAHLAT